VIVIRLDVQLKLHAPLVFLWIGSSSLSILLVFERHLFARRNTHIFLGPYVVLFHGHMDVELNAAKTFKGACGSYRMFKLAGVSVRVFAYAV